MLDKQTGVDDWRKLTKIAGQIADKEDEANKLVEDVNNEISETAKKYPNLKGKTFTWGMFFGGQYSAVANPNDPSNDLFTRLGFEVNPKLREFAKKENRVNISPEKVDLLDSDFTLMWHRWRPQQGARLEAAAGGERWSRGKGIGGGEQRDLYGHGSFRALGIEAVRSGL